MKISEIFFLHHHQSVSSSPIANVSMKLLAFWPEAAEVWFAQADAQFRIWNISVSKTKFYHTVTVLSQEDASHILNLINAPQLEDFPDVLSSNGFKASKPCHRV